MKTRKVTVLTDTLGRRWGIAHMKGDGADVLPMGHTTKPGDRLSFVSAQGEPFEYVVGKKTKDTYRIRRA